MGNNTARDLAENVVDIRQSIAIQLRSNHYPPVPLSMVEPCVKAIYAVSDGETHKQIDLPKGIFWRGYPTAPAYAIVEGHHLGAWCSYDDWDDYDHD
jgi:hypothetical protein